MCAGSATRVSLRVFHLAGYAALPDFVDFDDALPGDPAP